MREPSLQQPFHEMANPPQTREGEYNHELHATQVRTRCCEDFTCACNHMICLSVCPLYRTAHETVAAKCLNDYHLTATMLHSFLLVKLLILSESHLILKPED